MDLSSVADDLYGLAPQRFTAARDALSGEARAAGARELAASIKQLRRPAVSAWMANMLARQQTSEVERLIGLGEDLRAARSVDGEQIRAASKDKATSVSKLLRQARAIAKRAEQAVSVAAEQDLEATLDAAFSDPRSAASLLEGRLVNPLHYSGLGFAGAAGSKPASGRSGLRSPEARSDDDASTLKSRRALEQATREAARADADVEKAQRAVAAAEADLKRLRAALAVADRKAKKARQQALAAGKRIGGRKGSTRR